ncbi:MAG: response regulator [Clostridiales bacterium]|nr:response regulator [Clostridiales bacterium]
MREIIYQDKRYEETDNELQKAIAVSGMYFFRYYYQDRLVIVAETTVERFACKRFYPNMPQSFAEEIVCEEDQAAYYGMYEAISCGEKKASAVFGLKNGRGTVRVVLSVFEKDENGGPAVVVGMIEDVTDELAKERENKARERKYTEQQVIFKSINRALSSNYNNVYLVDLDDGKVNAYQISGEIRKEYGATFEKGDYSAFIRLYVSKTVYEPDRPLFDPIIDTDSLRKSMQIDNSCTFNYRVLRDEKVQYFKCRAVRTDIEGRTYCTIAFRDINSEIIQELKQKTILEEQKTALEEQKSLLEEREAQLRKALASAESANKAKTTFLSNMSHDIRTPMNAIIGYTTLAMAHSDNQKLVQDYLVKIMSASNHLLSLINDILDMSRIESGRMLLEESECNLSEIMHGIRDILQADMKSKRLNFYIDTVDVFNEHVICDKLRLNQILLNLLGNAVKFTQPGGTISVRIFQKNAERKGYARYEFHVRDTGIGMSEEFLTHIFEPFERERNTTVSGIQGTGLGMPITKNIVEMMGGTIAVTSRQGEGSEFTVEIPMKILSAQEAEVKVEELEGAHALVVDDDFNTCDSVSTMLIQMGMRAEWTMSGKEAILRTRQAVSRNDEYYVYILDWLVPDMNGIEIARQIRREVGEDAPIIILTAYDWSEIEEEGKEAGVTAFCSKPLFFSDLRRCLTDILYANEKKEAKSADLIVRKKFEGKRILLVEDNDLNREIAGEILSEAGFIVEEAGDGDVAVEKLQEKGAGYYNLVMMDIQMPVMDGYEATKAIRSFEDKELAGIPVIAMTANAFEEDKKNTLESGMNAHIAKPIDVKALFETLGRILK